MWFYNIVLWQASRRRREGRAFFLLVSYQPLAAFIDDKKQGDVTPYDRGIDASDTQQHRNHSANRDASRRAAA